MSFSYSDEFATKKIDPNKTYLEQYLLNRQVQALRGSSNIAVAVRNYPDAILDNEPAYVIRKANPNKYKMTQKTVGKNQAVIFENTSDGELELTAFTRSDPKKLLAIITLSTTESSIESIKPEFNQLLESFTWR